MTVLVTSCGKNGSSPPNANSPSPTLTPEPKKIEKTGEGKSDSKTTPALRSNVLDASRFILNDRQFRQALILDRARPLSYPDQLRERFDLSSLELAAVCTFALRVKTDENIRLTEKYPVTINTQISMDFLKAYSGGGNPEMENHLADSIEKALGLSLRKTK